MTEQDNKAPRPVRVAAIDPGSRKAGMVVLQIQPPQPGFVVPDSDAVAVLARYTARPRATKHSDDFAYRMLELEDLTETWANDVRRNWDPALWAIEDPRDAFTPGKQLRGRGAIISLGAAFGVACSAFSRAGLDPVLVGAQTWYPKMRGGANGNRIHSMKHKQARDFLRQRWPALQACTDDETFASGVAIWAYTRGAMAATYPI